MSFELRQLREAAEKYPFHDAGTHGGWPRRVWERRNESPATRLDDAVEFLGKWKVLRFKDAAKIREFVDNVVGFSDQRGLQPEQLDPIVKATWTTRLTGVFGPGEAVKE